jgi:2'-5' RNA ligase
MNNISRLFLALWPEISIQEAIQDWRDQWAWQPKTSLVPRESLHLTLHFLGNMPDSHLPELVQGLKVAFQPFDLSFSHPVMWPHGIAVLEPDSIPDNLLNLHASLEAALQRLGLSIEARKYHPHITLARHATGAILTSSTQKKLIQWHVHSYALIESQAQTHSYRVVQTFSMENKMKWTDSRAIAIELAEKHPEVDPKQIRFTQLRTWVLELENFDDVPEHCGEKILEAIQLMWMDEADEDEDN